MAIAARDIRAAARHGFGYQKLRAGQQEAIGALAEGRDVVAVMPTGFGKSAIYQVAGLLVDGPTVVVSPLIALQHDQVATILGDGSGGAVVANSTLSEGARRTALDGVGSGEVEFLFLAPEQFANPDTMAALRANPPSLFVVDEAHCISAWGHDFRPSYLHLAPVLAELGHPRVLALTATAAPPVREEIVARLGLDDPLVIVKGFDRPNIGLAVDRHVDARQRDDALLDAAVDAAKPGIVYTATRARAEELGRALADRGVAAGVYHGGLAARPRAEVQDAFMGGELDVVAATNAFGLGIDKADVRFVFHAEPSESLDSYYQEVGRAGRDGEPAEAVLFWRAEDLGVRRFFATGPKLERAELERVARMVAAAEGREASIAELAELAGMKPGRVATAVGWLAREGALAVAAGGDPVRATGAVDPATAGRAAAAAAAARRRLDRSRVEMVRSYAETRGCRRQLLLGYFGEPFEPPCEACDNCRDGGVEATTGPGPFPVGTRVVHRSLGEGTVTGAEDGKVVVLFDDRGYTTLATDVVLEQGLLTARP
ncbi:MAG: RecQ family ATP-dependent DNA helicase [Acidimicrobiia bacterium]